MGDRNRIYQAHIHVYGGMIPMIKQAAFVGYDFIDGCTHTDTRKWIYQKPMWTYRVYGVIVRGSVLL